MMAASILITFLYFTQYFSYIVCPYPPTGDEVQAGSVLLPASRRGRYLANIVRRQAVDGTGIKFNKDADRMNAEAKKKVDVLSEELLPYIIAEQERRTTLHKRVMTAIQNGEKGITVAEIRNKPPLIIRKGMLYRCPSNRAPKEPDGSGVLMCDEEITPTQVMYDSCLSVEDRDLYVAENKYFFCNRHKIEGPDLPRNGTTVIGCAPSERTSFNYTMTKCALEGTDDVVVHYRYYPDRTYKFVSELDPDREVCDHWNPCQIGYIYSIPSQDMALPATELWGDYEEKPDEYERDEIVESVPEDSLEEMVSSSVKKYESSPRYVSMPTTGRNCQFSGVRMKDNFGTVRKVAEKHFTRKEGPNNTLVLTVTYSSWKDSYYGTYFAVFGCASGDKFKKFLTLSPSAAQTSPKTLTALHGQKLNKTQIPFKCNRCRLQSMLLRSPDGTVSNVDTSRYRLRDVARKKGTQSVIEIDLNELKPHEFGDYFALVQNGDGLEERIKVLTIKSPGKDTARAVRVQVLYGSYDVGTHVDRSVRYECTNCELTDILCNGNSVDEGRISKIQQDNSINFNFPRFEDSYSCVYVGFFTDQQNGEVYQKPVGVIDNSSPTVSLKRVRDQAPALRSRYHRTIKFVCDDCTVDRVLVNGLQLRTSQGGSEAFFTASSSGISIRIPEFKDVYSGIYQAIFNANGERVTKTILVICDDTDCDEGLNDDSPATSAPNVDPQGSSNTDEPAPETTPEPDPVTEPPEETTEETTPVADETTPAEIETTTGEIETTTEEIQTTPAELKITPGESETTPGELETTPGESETTPGASDETPSEGETTPGEGEPPTSEGDSSAPTEGVTTPGEGEPSTNEGDSSAPAEGVTTPGEGDPSAPTEAVTTPGEGDPSAPTEAVAPGEGETPANEGDPSAPTEAGATGDGETPANEGDSSAPTEAVSPGEGETPANEGDPSAPTEAVAGEGEPTTVAPA